mmetsp:Transcript_2932/g.4489  ORF Transcript_2932/g.4489 Transcript_2932/m.4489 type:complete len:229 (-) Transcript_2932:177-863(-)
MRTGMMLLTTLVMMCGIVSCAGMKKLSTDIVELTSDNFNDTTAGKTVFIMFHVFWCSHCQSFYPTWNKLSAKYNNTSLLIAHVDCNEGSERDGLCKRHDIKGTPTLLYGEPGHNGAYLQQYTGDNEDFSVSSFVKKRLLQPFCSPANLNACDDKTRQRIADWEQTSPAELGKSIEQIELRLEKAHIEAKEGFKVLQAHYDEIQRAKVLNDARINDKIRILKEVIAAKQ